MDQRYGANLYDKDEFMRIRRKYLPKLLLFGILQGIFLIFFWFDLYLPKRVSIIVSSIFFIPFLYYSIGFDKEVRELPEKAIESMEIKVDKTATTLLYILSFLIPLAGFIVGAIYLSKEEEHYKHVGKNCLIFSVLNIVMGFLMVALLFA